jgi:hypothetical protein
VELDSDSGGVTPSLATTFDSTLDTTFEPTFDTTLTIATTLTLDTPLDTTFDPTCILPLSTAHYFTEDLLRSGVALPPRRCSCFMKAGRIANRLHAKGKRARRIETDGSPCDPIESNRLR